MPDRARWRSRASRRYAEAGRREGRRGKVAAAGIERPAGLAGTVRGGRTRGAAARERSHRGGRVGLARAPDGARALFPEPGGAQIDNGLPGTVGPEGRPTPAREPGRQEGRALAREARRRDSAALVRGTHDRRALGIVPNGSGARRGCTDGLGRPPEGGGLLVARGRRAARVDSARLVVTRKGGRRQEPPIARAVANAIRPLVVGKDPTELVYPRSYSTFARDLSQVGRRAGVGPVSAHHPRRSFGRILYYEHRQDLNTIRALYGHASVAMTEYYIGASMDALRSAVATFDHPRSPTLPPLEVAWVMPSESPDAGADFSRALSSPINHPHERKSPSGGPSDRALADLAARLRTTPLVEPTASAPAPRAGAPFFPRRGDRK